MTFNENSVKTIWEYYRKLHFRLRFSRFGQGYRIGFKA